MELEFFAEYAIPVIVGICLCVGYIVKKWVRDLDNKFIPSICAVIGLILAVWMAGWTFSPAVILQGLFSGLAATGLHQAFAQLIERKETEDED